MVSIYSNIQKSLETIPLNINMVNMYSNIQIMYHTSGLGLALSSSSAAGRLFGGPRWLGENKGN
jgi:hypothetical protein